MTVVKDKYRGTTDYALVYCELITAAKYRGTVTYQEIAKIMGLAISGNNMQKETGQILGEISEDEFGDDRPMLSAIAVGVSGLPGDGFYKLAREMGKLTNQPEDKFWEAEKKAVYETWKIKLIDKE
jgi:hypothetical protein